MSGKKWTEEELNLILTGDLSDTELSNQLDRTPQAIWSKRSKYKKKQANRPNVNQIKSSSKTTRVHKDRAIQNNTMHKNPTNKKSIFSKLKNRWRNRT